MYAEQHAGNTHKRTADQRDKANHRINEKAERSDSKNWKCVSAGEWIAPLFFRRWFVEIKNLVGSFRIDQPANDAYKNEGNTQSDEKSQKFNKRFFNKENQQIAEHDNAHHRADMAEQL